ncbi:Similar to XRCC3: DNA repair protein XRCC3 (Homo sapiens) [Cotesia congregata]|uniref:Similar to XRCC3: DNA repair protein XRCC3 (Homo sapiens) n=1 Tax=Cotesia congregata TaxID=51543 RepID=A0A8J2MC93_COTCN|nr:Similar to XRCC3: DNA repair protein XRCC3 (Homo sapiens) [Cotesia congregata]
MANFLTADKLSKNLNDNFLTTGCSIIDNLLRGGISKRGITQFYGIGGSGKTQLALQLCLTSQIPSLNGHQAEAKFPSSRFQQLLENSPIAKKYNLNGNKVFIEHISTVSDLEKCIIEQIPCMLRVEKIGLIVIDSIAAPYRVDYESINLKDRARSLRNISKALHNYSRSNISVVCINQLTAVVDNSAITDRVCNDGNPALGIIWACQITNSLCFCKLNNQRHIHIRESPYLARKTFTFCVENKGVFGLEEIT